MSSARVKLPPELEHLPLFVLFDVIKQANLGEQDMRLVQEYIIRQIPQDDLAAELGWSRRTVYVHLKRSISKMAEIAQKLYAKYT